MTLPFGANDLSRDKANLSRPTAKIENHFAFAQITGRIAAAVIALDDFRRNYAQVCGVIFNGATEIVCAFFCSRRVTLADDGFGALWFNHW